MNPPNWDVPSILRDLPQNNNCMEDTSRANNEWGTYCEYSRHGNDETQRSMGVHVGWQGHSLPSHNFYKKDSDVVDSDGGLLEMEEEDPELSRKRKELQQIQERIILKKAAIALKTVELLVNKTVPSDSYNDHSATYEGQTLKDRVNVILKQRHPPSFLSKVRESRNSSSLSRQSPPQDNHPLKLRVNALMKQRCSGPVLPANREIPDVTLPPASGSVTSPANEENDINKGFQRFLSVLNKGVDMDFLSRIVTNDSEDLPLGKELIVQPSALETTSDPASVSESQHSNSGASLPGCSQTNCGERKTDLPSQKRSFSERLSLHYDEEKRNDGGNRCFGSGSRPKSPSAVKKRQRKEEEQPKVDEQQEHLQNILKTRGLSLEGEEMNKLEHLTQEKLYGKKHEDTKVDSRGDQESQPRSFQRHYSISSSSSASSRSTRSRGSSPSPSTSQHRCSHSTDSKQWFEHSCSSGRSRDRLKRRDDNQDSKEAQSHRDKDDKVMLPLNKTITSPANEENDINKGFQRFLSVLNEGVDMDFLSRIFTNDSEGLPLGNELIVQPSALETTSDPASVSESQHSNSGASLPGGSQTNSEERMTDLPGQKRSCNERLSLHYDEEKRNDGSCSRSKSPVKKKKKKDEEQSKVDEQQEHLQNILKTLGLSLEVEEMNKLAHRTQERLYGKKHEDTKVDSRGDQESQPRSSQRHYSISSSSSRSTRSRDSVPSASTSQHRCSCSLSRGRSRDRLKQQEDQLDNKEAQSYRDKDDKEISTYQHPYPQNQTYPQSCPASISEFPDYSLSQNSEYYNADTNSYWTHGTTPSSLNPLGNFHHFPGPVKPSNMVYPNHNQDFNLLMNPDLSKSEGQIGPVFGPRCLQVISTKKPSNDRCLMQPTNSHRRWASLACIKMAKTKAKKKRNKRKKRLMNKQKQMEAKLSAKLSAKLVEKAEVPQLDGDEDDSKDEQPEAKKVQPTEEEIKSRLGKWFEAYNQKMKPKIGTNIQLSTLSRPPLD